MDAGMIFEGISYEIEETVLTDTVKLESSTIFSITWHFRRTLISGIAVVI